MNGKFHALLTSIADRGQSHRGTAFIIESLLLLVFVTASVAIVVQLIGDGYAQSEKADKLSTAIFIASNEAERFTADPTIKSGKTIYVSTENGPEKASSKKSSEGMVEFEDESLSIDDPRVFVMSRKVESESLSAGKLYSASIKVDCQGKKVYSIETSRYIPSSQSDDGDEGGDDSNDGNDSDGGEGEL